MSAPEPVIHVSVSLGDGTSVRVADHGKPWVQLGGLQDICMHPHSAAVAREVAQAFIEVAGLIEARKREAASVRHSHGQHGMHSHSPEDYAGHQQPIDNEVRA